MFSSKYLYTPKHDSRQTQKSSKTAIMIVYYLTRS